MLPLSTALVVATVFGHLGLAYCRVEYYQLVRTLLPPAGAVINLFLYRTLIPTLALVALVPVASGLIMVTYYNLGRGGEGSSLPEAPLGAIFAFAGVLVGAWYNVWQSVFRRRYQMDASQVLLAQAPLGTVVLAYGIPWADRFPEKGHVEGGIWQLLVLVRMLFIFSTVRISVSLWSLLMRGILERNLHLHHSSFGFLYERHGTC